MNIAIKNIYDLLNKLSKEQKKIIYITAVVLFFLLLFWFFVYIPQSSGFNSIKNNLKQVESQIKEIMSLTAGKELTQAVSELKINLVKLNSQLPEKDEAIIAILSESAAKFKIEVKNITPATPRTLENKIFGYEVKEFPISLNLSCEFKTLGEFLDALRNNFPVLIQVKELEITGEGEGKGNLNVNLQILAYLSEEKK